MLTAAPHSTGAQWVRSRYCVGESNCVEIALMDDRIGMRNSRTPAQVVYFDKSAWRDFLTGIAAGQIPSGD